MKQINTAVRNINAIRKQLNEMNVALKNEQNVRDYDRIDAEISIALNDLDNEIDALKRVVRAKIDLHSDMMSLNAHKISTERFMERALTHAAECGITIK